MAKKEKKFIDFFIEAPSIMSFENDEDEMLIFSEDEIVINGKPLTFEDFKFYIKQARIKKGKLKTGDKIINIEPVQFTDYISWNVDWDAPRVPSDHQMVYLNKCIEVIIDPIEREPMTQRVVCFIARATGEKLWFHKDNFRAATDEEINNPELQIKTMYKVGDKVKIVNPILDQFHKVGIIIDIVGNDYIIEAEDKSWKLELYTSSFCLEK
jgi:hypothetical protein